MLRRLRLLLVFLSSGVSLKPRANFRLSTGLSARLRAPTASDLRIPAALLLSTYFCLVQLFGPSSVHAETTTIGVPVDVVNIMKSRYAEIRAGVTGEKVRIGNE